MDKLLGNWHIQDEVPSFLLIGKGIPLAHETRKDVFKVQIWRQFF